MNPLRALCRRRAVRFGLVGTTAAGIQLAILDALLATETPALVANGIAFFVAANFNFTLSGLFTWSDRSTDALARRWRRFFTAISFTALLNMAVFGITEPLIGGLSAAALGLAVAALANYIAADRAVFANRRRARPPAGPVRSQSTRSTVEMSQP